MLLRANRELVAKKNRVDFASRRARTVMDELTGKTVIDLPSKQGRITVVNPADKMV